MRPECLGDPERVPAMCFLDLVGYTRLTDERGDQAAAELAAALALLVDGSARGHGGWPVKWLGDGVMVYFRSLLGQYWPHLKWLGVCRLQDCLGVILELRPDQWWGRAATTLAAL